MKSFRAVGGIVVVAALGLAMGTLISDNYSAKRAKVQADMRGMMDAMDLFNVKTGRYPRELSELWERPGDVRAWGPEPYLKEYPPLDPWGNGYGYEHSRGRDFEIVSYGADGGPGGSDEATDLSSQTVFQEG